MPSIKECSKCNSSFECTSDATECWCKQYTLSQEVLQHLKGNYADCLCPQCLATYAEDYQAENQ